MKQIFLFTILSITLSTLGMGQAYKCSSNVDEKTQRNDNQTAAEENYFDQMPDEIMLLIIKEVIALCRNCDEANHAVKELGRIDKYFNELVQDREIRPFLNPDKERKSDFVLKMWQAAKTDSKYSAQLALDNGTHIQFKHGHKVAKKILKLTMAHDSSNVRQLLIEHGAKVGLPNSDEMKKIVQHIMHTKKN